MFCDLLCKQVLANGTVPDSDGEESGHLFSQIARDDYTPVEKNIANI